MLYSTLTGRTVLCVRECSVPAVTLTVFAIIRNYCMWQMGALAPPSASPGRARACALRQSSEYRDFRLPAIELFCALLSAVSCRPRASSGHRRAYRVHIARWYLTAMRIIRRPCRGR